MGCFGSPLFLKEEEVLDTKKRIRRWRGLNCIFASLLVIVVGASGVAEQWKSTIDSRLGTVSSRVETLEAENPEDLYSYQSDYADTTELVNAHKDLAERLQEEGSVLLKNENDALPLAQGAAVTLLGMRSYNPVYGGQIGSDPAPTQNVSLEIALSSKGFRLNPVMKQVYYLLGNVSEGGGNPYMPGALSTTFSVSNDNVYKLKIGEPPLAEYANLVPDYADSFANFKDAAIVAVGRPSSESGDFFPGEAGMEDEGAENILGLTENERAVIALAKENFEKVIVLVNSSSAMEIEELKQDQGVDAILWIGQPGNYGFNGVADILCGAVSPSGHLPDTYVVDSTSSPGMRNFGVIPYTNQDAISDGKASYTDYRAGWYIVEAEGIYSGYRYYETRYADTVMGQGKADSSVGSHTGGAWKYENEVSYPFGYGLSYTEFTQTLDEVVLNREDNTVTAKVTVQNTGGRAGKSVVQVYAQAPYTAYDIENKVEKAAVQLLGFEKTQELAPGASEQVTVVMDLQYLASYDYVNAKTYIMDEGDYYLAIGDDAHDALNNILAMQGMTAAHGMDRDGDKAKAYTWRQDSFDDETFAVSKAGVQVTNRLEDADLNYYLPGAVVYLSRNDWEGTWPEIYDSVEASGEMIVQLRNDTYTIRTGDDTSSIFPERDNGMTLSMLKGAAYDDERWDMLLEQMKLDEICYMMINGNERLQEIPSVGSFATWEADGPAGFIKFRLGDRSSDTQSPTYVPPEDINAKYSLNDMPMEVVAGATFNKELLHEMGVLFGNDSLFVDTVFIWAPGMNLHRVPYNARNHEYYSEDSMLANYLGTAVVQGALTKGLIMAPKHLAFNNQETNRAGVCVYMNEQAARELALRAFQGIFEGGGMGTMTAYNRVGATFVNAHEGLMKNILRGEWDFKGYNITDWVNGENYMTVKESIVYGAVSVMDVAGSDYVASGRAWDYFTAQNLRGDAVFLTALRENMHYLFYTLVNSNAMNGQNASSRVINLMTWWRAALIGLEVCCVLLLLLGIWRYTAAVVKERKAVKKDA